MIGKTVGKVLVKICLGLGYSGLAIYGTGMIGMAIEGIREKIDERKHKQYNEGYNEGRKRTEEVYDLMLRQLRQENEELLKESLKKSEGA